MDDVKILSQIFAKKDRYRFFCNDTVIIKPCNKPVINKNGQPFH